MGLQTGLRIARKSRPPGAPPMPGEVQGMAKAWTCPFCHQVAAPQGGESTLRFGEKHISTLERIDCPNPKCGRISLRARVSVYVQKFDALGDFLGWGEGEVQATWSLIPQSRARAWPDYVPEAVVADYNESCAIEELSPKASATLSRRCLQSILRDYFKVSKQRLVDEIEAVEAMEGVSPDVIAALHALREVGNVGAHPSRDPAIIVDVEPEEAAAMIEFIEILLTETYVARAVRNARIAKTAVISARLRAAATPAVATTVQQALPNSKKPN